MRVELIYDSDCPNVSLARKRILKAFSEIGAPAHWVEWNRQDPDAPAYVQDYGSPTVLVDGNDLAGVSANRGAPCCRVYAVESGGFDGAPPVSLLSSRMQGRASRHPAAAGRRKAWSLIAPVGAFAGGVFALTPIGFCPACWPIYGGIAGALGLGFLSAPIVLIPLLILALALALATMLRQAAHRRGLGPFLTGAIGALALLAGKLLLPSDALVYIGIAVLTTASVWHVWPVYRSADCPACGPADSHGCKQETTTKEIGK